MMYGTRERFAYLQCSDCLCLQIETVPQDLARYYAGDYYSYRKAERRSNPVKRWTSRTRDHFAVIGRGFVGELLYRRAPVIELHSLQPLHLNAQSRVLDVGCGAGYLVFGRGELGLRRPPESTRLFLKRFGTTTASRC